MSHDNMLLGKTILDHYRECKLENQSKLKEVRNLEDLVKFKLSTVADKIKDNAAGSVKGLEIFRKLCDPLLVNKSYDIKLDRKLTTASLVRDKSFVMRESKQ